MQQTPSQARAQQLPTAAWSATVRTAFDSSFGEFSAFLAFAMI